MFVLLLRLRLPLSLPSETYVVQASISLLESTREMAFFFGNQHVLDSALLL